MTIFLIFLFTSITSELIQPGFDPEELLRSYISATENEEFKTVLTDDFAIYNCIGKLIGGSDFNMEKLKKLTDDVPFRHFEIISSDNQTGIFDVEIDYFGSTFEAIYIENEGWKIKSEQYKTCLEHHRPYHSSLLIDYQEIFAKKSQSLLEEYIKNIAIGQFPKHFEFVGDPNNTIISKYIEPLVKMIQEIPIITNNRYFIDGTSESDLRIFVSIDKTNIVILDVFINQKGEFEIKSEGHEEYSNDDTKIPWFTSAFIDYRQTYTRIVEQLVENFMRGPGTSNTELIRFIVGNSERNLESIRKEFDTRHRSQNLVEWISTDTSGSYKDALIALIKGNRDQ
ncbi:unnamed protein product [Caenorhabditis angaria]|uniref:DUF38 domain-containing protein n=1 Tax=Caenorhabditis angaria TaxID=860376 RepID=A0A9P1IN02_9PELO|nr:unnamed protein product [Caenorhabditis angaria]